MSVRVIDTIKPQTNGFPVVEAVDVAVDATTRLPAALAAKADVTTAESLQGQINQIVISSAAETVVAPEVAQARVSTDATEHETLADRLDSDFETLSEKIETTGEKTNEDITKLSEYIGKRETSFTVSTSQHSSRSDMIPWNGKTGDVLYISVKSSPAISPQRNGGVYTYLNDEGTEYGSILINNALPTAVTLTGNCDHIGIWIPALTEEHEITVTVESENSVYKSIDKLASEIISNEGTVDTLKSNLIGHDESDSLVWSDDFFNSIHINQGGYISSSDGVTIVSDSRYGYTDYIDMSDYMLVKLLHNVSETATHRIYVYDADKTYLAKSEQFSPTEENPFIFTGYKHAKYMRFSVTLAELDTYGLTAVNRIVYGADNIKSTNRSISASAKALIEGKIMSSNVISWDSMLTATFVNANNEETYFKEGLETGFVDVSDFNSIKIYLNPELTRGRAVKFYDTSDNIVRYLSLSATSEIIVPDDAVKMRMTIFGMTNDGYSDISYIKFYGIYGTQTSFVEQPYHGKKFSFLGDSITTFSGWLYPSENRTYYTGQNAGVSSVSDTWWYKLMNALGGTLEVNNSWSGSAVSNVRDESSKSGVKRCTNLGNPDVIIVRMGTNDFYYGAALGTYDGKTAIPTSETTFSDAFGKMLGLIMETYKTAEIWVCTMTQFERIGSVGYPEKNSYGETIAEWNERIRTIAKAYGAKILDDAMCGMTYQNIGVYTDDQPYETTGNGLHPNAAGMSLIANNCIRTMDASTRVRY